MVEMRRKGLLPSGLALMFIGLVAWLAGAVPASAAFPGRNGLIAFWGGRNFNNPQIYVMNADGTGVTDLSRSPNTFDGLPKWSPDGTQIVFSRSINGSPLNLYRMNADGSGVTRLTNQNEFLDAFAAWTADGRIVFPRGQGECSPRTGLWLMNADGSGLRRITDPSITACLPATSPHGSKVAFTGSLDGGATLQIYTIRLDGTGLQRVSPEGTVFDYRPNWSPDGNDLVFLNAPASGEFNRSVWTVHANGSNRTRVLEGTPSWDAPAWSPDGRYIVLHTCTTDQQVLAPCHIEVVGRDGTGRVQLTFAPSGGFDANADWQPLR